jgi:sugar porter (SP) family MFS transporter
MNLRIFLWSLAAALAGFLFGFDTVVKSTLLWIGVFYIVGAVGTGLAWNVEVFVVARFVGGLGIGISTVVAPMYIAEIAPPNMRGRLAGMLQFNIVFGILIAFVSNVLLAGIGENAWRWMLGAAAFPSLLYALSCFAFPESPRWLLSKKGDREAGIQVLQRLQPGTSASEIAAEADEILAASAEKVSSGRFWTPQLRKPIMLAILIAFFNPLSGINALLYFAPRIFGLAGLGAKTALLQSVGIGFTNLVFTFVGLWLIDRLGRRTLLYIGSFGYIGSLSLVYWGFFKEHYSIIPARIFAFIAAHAIGQGAVIWVFISEIFPNRHRAERQSLGSFTHWVFAAVLTTFFPKIVSSLPPGYVFLFFTGMMCLQLLWAKAMVPETKNVPLEVLQKELAVG